MTMEKPKREYNRAPRKYRRNELAGLTPVVMAELADISLSYAFKIQDGGVIPGIEVLERIAGVVSMSLEELVAELRRRQRAA